MAKEADIAVEQDDTLQSETPESVGDGKQRIRGNAKDDVYIAAAECLDAILHRRASIKSAIFKSEFADKRMLLALTQKTFDNLPHLKKIVYDTQITKKEPRLNKVLSYVLVYEMLFGNSKKRRGALNIIGKHQKLLKTQLEAYLKEHGATSLSEIRKSSAQQTVHPRYVRVNTLKATADEVKEELKKTFSIDEESKNAVSQFSFLKNVRRMKAGQALEDYHIPDLFIFHPTVGFHDHELEKSGKIILQDKASCLPALLLNPEPGSTVIDACAAPGMKTSHLAGLMKNEGKIFAVDRSEDRSKLLSDMLAHYGVTCAEVINSDFLLLDPTDERFSSVKYILLDPTCSGSGVTSKDSSFVKTKRNKKEALERLKKLQGLQTKLLKHALSFPSVERVVYSTCSINLEEDEEVVQDAMKSYSASFIVRPYSKFLPKWKGCGKPRFSIGPNCLRAFSEKHLTNGFFAAVIERVKPEEIAEMNMNAESREEPAVVESTTPKLKSEEPEPGMPKLSRAEKMRRKRHRPDEPTVIWSFIQPAAATKDEADTAALVPPPNAEQKPKKEKKKKSKPKNRSGASRRKKIKALKRLNQEKPVA